VAKKITAVGVIAETVDVERGHRERVREPGARWGRNPYVVEIRHLDREERGEESKEQKKRKSEGCTQIRHPESASRA
jgi:hypothetical protein